jgi:hypothetical protein
MFFYISLFVACVIIALVILYLYNSVAGVGKLIHRTLLPISKNNLTAHLEDKKLATTINDTPTPWGWESHSTPENVAQTHPAAPSGQRPWGWPGNHHATYDHRSTNGTGNASGSGIFHAHNGSASTPEATESPTVGWPYREEKFEFAGKAYKVTRKAKLKRTDLSTTSKPWGW